MLVINTPVSNKCQILSTELFQFRIIFIVKSKKLGKNYSDSVSIAESTSISDEVLTVEKY